MSKILLVAGAVTLALTTPALATPALAETEAAATTAPTAASAQPAPTVEPGLWSPSRTFLTGDWGGLRSRLKAGGVTVTANYQSESAILLNDGGQGRPATPPSPTRSTCAACSIWRSWA